MNVQRSVLVYEQAMKSDATKKSYFFQLNKFKKYYHIKDFDSLLTIDPKKLQIMLEDYLFRLKDTQASSSIQTAFYAIELFFSMNDMMLNFKKIRKMFPPLQKRTGMAAYTTEDIQKILDTTSSRKHKALVHFLASSGVRIGAVTDLKLKHLEDMEFGCKSVLVYADEREEYPTFLTPEAVTVLNDYFDERRKSGEFLTDESPVFASRHRLTRHTRINPLTEGAAIGIIYRLATRAETRRKKQTQNRYNIQGAHGFRKRFNTILKSNNDVNPNLAEKLMGHSTSIRLDNSYLIPSKKRLFTEFVKVIPELSISESVRLKMNNDTLAKKLEEFESNRDVRLQELETKLNQVKQLLEQHNLNG